MLTLAQVTTNQIIVNSLVAVFLLVCIVLILTVLIQRPQGGGLSGAFGAGGGAGQTAFGTKTGDALTMATILMFLAFLGFGIGLNFATRPQTVSAARPTATAVQTEGSTTVEGEEPAERAVEEGQAPPVEGGEPVPETEGGDEPEGGTEPASEPAEMPSPDPSPEGVTDDAAGDAADPDGASERS